MDRGQSLRHVGSASSLHVHHLRSSVHQEMAQSVGSCRHLRSPFAKEPSAVILFQQALGIPSESSERIAKTLWSKAIRAVVFGSTPLGLGFVIRAPGWNANHLGLPLAGYMQASHR